jgi:hypothetical protein
VAFAALAAVPACEEPVTIAELQKVVDQFVDIRNVVVPGQGRLVFTVTVPGDAIHPHLEGRWTVNNVERPVDLYVFRQGTYDGNQPPSGQDHYWTSEPPAGSGIGQERNLELHIHPSPGEWTLVFFNPGTNPLTTRTELSAELQVNYWR